MHFFVRHNILLKLDLKNNFKQLLQQDNLYQQTLSYISAQNTESQNKQPGSTVNTLQSIILPNHIILGISLDHYKPFLVNHFRIVFQAQIPKKHYLTANNQQNNFNPFSTSHHPL